VFAIKDNLKNATLIFGIRKMFFGVMQQSKKVEINYDGSNVTVSRMSHSGFVAFRLSLLVVHFYTHYTKHEFFKTNTSCSDF
jgi:hypothetical protein